MSGVATYDPTRIGEILGQGVQFGLGLGQRAYENEQDQASHDRQMRLREMEYERELADRQERGARVARSIQADSNIERALDGLESRLLNSGGVTPGPRPMGMGGMDAMGPFPQDGSNGFGGAAAGVAGGMGPSPMPQSAGAGMGHGPGGAVVGPSPMPASILDVISPDDYANASPGVKARVSSAMTNLVGELRKRAQAKANVDFLLRTEVNGAPALRSIKPDLAEELFKAGALQGVPDEHFPVALLDQKHQQDMQEHAALLDHLTLGTAPGGVGPVTVDMAERDRLGNLSTVDLRAERTIRAKRDAEAAKKVEVEAQRKSMLVDLQGRDWFKKLPPERQYAAQQNILAGRDITLASLTHPKPMVDTTIDNRVGLMKERAKLDLDIAEKNYSALNMGENGKTSGLNPPTPEEIALAQQPKASRSWFSTDATDDAAWNAARSKVRAWNEFVKARHNFNQTTERGEAMFKGQAR